MEFGTNLPEPSGRLAVEMPAPYLSLEYLVSAMAAAVARANRNAEELQNPEETMAAAALTWESRLRELADSRAIKGHDWDSLAAEDWVHLNIERDVFFVDDLNTCRELTEAGFRFVVVENEREHKEFVAAFEESVLNDTPIKWRYWVEQMPSLAAREAARLMAALDPNQFEDLNARPNRNDSSRARQEVVEMARLASAEGKERDTASGWLLWAKERGFKVHAGFELAVNDKCQQDEAAAALRQLPAQEAAYWNTGHEAGAGRRSVTFKFAGLQSTQHFTLPSFIEAVSERLTRWKEGRYAIVEAAQVIADANPGNGADGLCQQMESAIHAGKLTLRKNGIAVRVEEVPRGRLWDRYVREKDVNEWLAKSDAGYGLEYPYSENADQPQRTSEATMPNQEKETAENRQQRRFDRHEAMGGRRVAKTGGGWKAGVRGVLVALAKEEAAAGRQYSNVRDVARDLDAEADRRKAARAMGCG